jgi:hypothetical protein
MFVCPGQAVAGTAACEHYSDQFGSICNTYLYDNSDWWSQIPDERAACEPNATLVRPSADRADFQILGISVWRGSDRWLRSIVRKLGTATILERGDASVGRAQVCYRSATPSERVKLVFEQSECAEGIYLFVDGKPFVGSDRCVPTMLVDRQLKTPTGLGIGLSRAQVLKILGRPSCRNTDSFVYAYSVMLKKTKENLEEEQKDFPNYSPDPDYEDDLSILIRFRKGRSWYFYLASNTCTD